MKEGIESYNGGSFRGAIEIWLQSLLFEDKENEIGVRKYLAQAYQQIGEMGINLLYEYLAKQRVCNKRYTISL